MVHGLVDDRENPHPRGHVRRLADGRVVHVDAGLGRIHTIRTARAAGRRTRGRSTGPGCVRLGSGGTSRGYLEPSSISAFAFSNQDRMAMFRNMVAGVAR